jgi:hypothetical protein
MTVQISQRGKEYLETARTLLCAGRFIPKSERERTRLIREARAIYDSVFQPTDPVSEQRDEAPASHTVSGANAHRSDGVLLS